MFVNFANVLQTTRKKPPFGIAQVGKSFRNEITPQNCDLPHPRVRADGDGVLRPARRGRRSGTSTGATSASAGTSDLGIPADMLRLRAHDADELSHYSAGTSDVEFAFPWGWDELEGIANRTDYDLTQHAKSSGEKLDYFDQATGERYVPHVIEPAAGATRTMAAFLLAAYDEDEVGGETRTVLRLHPRLAPVQGGRAAAVEEGHAHARRPRRCSSLLAEHWMCDYDETQAIGRRYRRQDEIGTPLCRHRRLRLARGPGRHHPRPGHHRAGPGAGRRAGRGASATRLGF